MIWQAIVISLFIAVLFTAPLILLFGWRRPNATADESGVLSGTFFFTVLFLALWAGSAWLRPWGPELWGIPWLAMIVLAAVLALVMVAVTGTGGRPTQSSYANPTRTGASGTAQVLDSPARAIEGFGMMFWVLVVLLLLAAVFGGI